MPHDLPAATVELGGSARAPGVSRRTIRRAALCLLVEGLRLPGAQLSLSLIGDGAMRALNAHWRQKDRVTDVLSFPAQAPAPSPSMDRARPLPVVPGQPVWLGDVAICLPQANRQAAALGHAPQDEVLALLVHGLLHLRGHDHVHGGRQAARMRREEARLLALVLPATSGARCLLSRADAT